jgi:hypothetical protein
MAKVSRRRLLKTTSIGAATVGMLAAAPHLAALAAPAAEQAPELSATSLSGPMVTYVRNLAKGEVGILVGEREIVYHDTDLVKRLLKATQ